METSISFFVVVDILIKRSLFFFLLGHTYIAFFLFLPPLPRTFAYVSSFAYGVHSFLVRHDYVTFRPYLILARLRLCLCFRGLDDSDSLLLFSLFLDD